MINHRSMQNLKVDILARISEKLECNLISERDGLSFSSNVGISRWLQMDSKSCALIFDIVPDTDLSFDISSWSMKCFHSLYILKGNIVLGGFEKNEFINLRPSDFLFFHSHSHTLNVKIMGGHQSQLVFISHSFPSPRDLRFKLPSKSHLYLDVTEGKSLTILENIFGITSELGQEFLLKGRLFELFGTTLPSCYSTFLNPANQSVSELDNALPVMVPRGRARPFQDSLVRTRNG